MSEIPVQTPHLAMIGLGEHDAPVDPTDPHDLEGPGIHLRWSFATATPLGDPARLDWPEAGFTLYRRLSGGIQDPTMRDLDLPATAHALDSSGVLRVLPGAQLEFDPDLLRLTLARTPKALDDLALLLDSYPDYVTLRFDDPVRVVLVTCDARPGAPAGTPVTVLRAHDGPVTVDEAVLAGDVGQLNVFADRITHVRLRVDGTRLVEVTRVLAPATTDPDDWDLVAELPPLTEWAQVSSRVPAEMAPAYEAGWADLGAELTSLFDPAIPVPRWDRTSTDPGVTAGPAEGPPPTWSQAIQGRILLFSLDPFIARLLGLLYVDTDDVARGDQFLDYLVTADFGGSIGTVGWICHDLSIFRHPALAPPRLVTAEVTPARTFLPDPETGALLEQADIGLSWTVRPDGQAGSLAAAAVRFDVEARPDGSADWELLTAAAPVVVGGAIDDLGELRAPQYLLIDQRPAGTHSYRVRAIDVFGRRSQPSNRLDITVRDIVGPPPPVSLRVRYLDPADPFLAADERGLGEGLLVRFALPSARYEAGSDGVGLTVYAVQGARDRTLDWRDAATWGTPVGGCPRQDKVPGEATAVEVVDPGDPAAGSPRVVRVSTDLPPPSWSGRLAGSRWTWQPGHLLVGQREYPVETVESGDPASFLLSWPAALGLADPVPGPCTWYPGYQVFLSRYRAQPLTGQGSVSGAVAAGAVDRAGNAGPVTAPAGFQWVDRTVPGAPPAFDLGVEQLLASTPDPHGRSRFTLTWAPPGAGQRVLVCRATDVSVLDRHGRAQTDAAGLSSAELVALAADPAADPAFSVITTAAVEGTGYTDEALNGLAANRYLYRLRLVSPAGSLGPLGPPAPPVAIPDVVPPREPRMLRALGGAGSITLAWAPNRERDADHYVVYRAEAASAADIRLMTAVGTVAQDGAAAELTFRDGTPPVGVDLRYRVAAVDTSGNRSRPSRALVARCFAAPPTISRGSE